MIATNSLQMSQFTDGNVLKPDEIWANTRGTEFRVRTVDLETGIAVLQKGVNGTGTKIRKPFNPPPKDWVRKSGSGLTH